MATRTAVTRLKGAADELALSYLVVAFHLGLHPFSVHIFLDSFLCTIRRLLLV